MKKLVGTILKKYNKNKNILFKDLVLNEKPIYLIPHASLHKLFI